MPVEEDKLLSMAAASQTYPTREVSAPLAMESPSLTPAAVPDGLRDEALLGQLPTHLSASLRAASSSDAYLSTLALASLSGKEDASITARLFMLFEPVFADLAGRWLSLARKDPAVYAVPVISAFSKILPFAQYLRPLAHAACVPNDSIIDIASLDDDDKQHYLLAMFRLLSLDPFYFADIVTPIALVALYDHEVLAIRYLAIRSFALHIRAADAATQALLDKYTGTKPLEASWEGRVIDYRWLSLWEEQRWQRLETDLREARSHRDRELFSAWIRTLRDTLAPGTAEIGGVVVPATTERHHVATLKPLVHTPTVSRNLQCLGEALLSADPILLTGLPGSGKTTLVTAAAAAVGQLSTMITLHLNEQTDSKSLLGVYSTSAQAGAFTWQPGVLTQAAREGRWVLIEDLDRAPAEVLGLILPLIERRELVIPSRRETIRCAEGFRVLATMRTVMNARGEETTPGAHMLGNRLWRRISVASMSLSEVEAVVRQQYPLLDARAATFIAMFERVIGLVNGDLARKSLQGRTPGLRDLMKFCSRAQRRLEALGCTTGREPVPEALDEAIFMDAVDCFAAYLPTGISKDTLCGVMAQELQLSPQRSHYCLYEQTPLYEDAGDHLLVGRETCLKRRAVRHKSGSKRSIFAPTRPSLRTMEQIVAALQLAEPLLLVGETGIGKTAVIQQLATLLNHRLVVVNLSQQSETTDLLGGFKPVNMRTLAVPLVDDFTDLFDLTFSAKKNQKFLNSVRKAVTHGNWPRLLVIMKEAVKMAGTLFDKRASKHVLGLEQDHQEQPQKKRRFDEPKYVALRERWDAFQKDMSEFEARSAQGDSSFAFAFVQGKIVKALRDGDWVLLDEINLASPDTLESIAGLLHHGVDGSPSVLLTEAGEVERIYGHPQFRIFGAMNPATDAGKRDLAPGLRSRFTEIFVNSPDTDIDDLVRLIDVYLGDLTASDLTASAGLAQLYLETKKLNAENRLTDGAGQKPHFSIRTLVRTLVYVRDQAATYGLRRAIYEGFCMSFLTLLSKDSESLVLPLLDKHVFASLKNARSVLSQMPTAPDDGQAYVRYKHYWMRQGPFAPEKQPHYIITPFIERNLMNLVRASSTRRFPILLQGPTSAGKTSMVEYLAKVSGNRFVRINNHEHTDLQEYLGTYVSAPDGRLVYQEGVLVEALRNGYWIVLDELNLAPTDVLEALNRLLDDNRELFLPESQEVVRPHPNFMLFATQNPAGLYGGRKILSRAFRNRFLELHFDDIPEDELEYILKERSQIAPSFCARIVAVYKRLSLLRQSTRLFEQRNSFATLRDLFRWAFRKADDREQLAINGFMLLAERVRDQAERKAVKKVIEEVMRLKLDESVMYGAQTLDYRLRELSMEAPTEIIWTPAMRRVFLLVLSAIQNDEPVLLVGETGCGKTQICQAIAEACRKQLHVINAHVNLETGDLIGAQRPIRNRAAIESRLRSDLAHVLGHSGSLDELAAEFRALNAERLNATETTVIDRIETSLAKVNSLFQWSNGSLITAMESGQHFLLDEISLADDSVLERLNSVLEPHRSILLAEKGSMDSMVTAKDGFQFLATMNPGGDYGKRELSAALRNRLTEIWVPQLSEADDILPILENKLTRPLPGVPAAMLEFAKWFKSQNQGSTSGSMSIRDLLSWVSFLNNTETLPMSEAIVHGAALVYIDTLGANPSALLATSTGTIQDDRLASLRKLSELFAIDATAIYCRSAEVVIRQSELQIGAFTMSLDASSAQDPQFALNAPTTVANALRVARGLQLAKPILLEGSPGVGKTTLVSTLARVLGKPLTRINLSEQTDLTDLFGSDVPVEGGEMGHFAWSDAPFLRALQHGGWVLLDEMNLASQSVLEGLNSCLDHRQEVFVAELDQTFHRHEEFVLFAAQNPHHQGGGRKGLPASFVNRFTVVYADSFTEHDLKLICRTISPSAPHDEIDHMVSLIATLNHAVADRKIGSIGGPWELNLRDISRWLKLLERTTVRVDPSQFLDVVVTHRFRTAGDREAIRTAFQELFSKSPCDKSLYHNLSIKALQVGFGQMHRTQWLQDTYTSHARLSANELAIAESLILSIDHNWPCVLVGPSGCGKTRLLKVMATICGTRLVELSLNADTDTMDLIGGFEQADRQRHVLSFLDELSCFLREHILQALQASRLDLAASLSQILAAIRGQSSDLGSIARRLHEIAQVSGSGHCQSYSDRCASLCATTAAPSKVGFEWTEGMFIQAVQKGDWVVLDNANLCNPSVLDRLNSLMEPDGCLIVSEQRTTDGSARVIHPHPNFRLFLTLDPRHGELSRAMRNRSTELFFLGGSASPCQPACLDYGAEALVYRARPCLQYAATLDMPSGQQTAFGVMLDHTAPTDLSALAASTSTRSLFAGNHTLSFASTLDRYSEVVREELSHPVVQTTPTVTDLNESSAASAGLWQPFSAIVNEPRLQSDFDHATRCRIISRAKLQQLWLQNIALRQHLFAAIDTAATKRPSDMTCLEKSLASTRSLQLKRDSMHALGSFLLRCHDTISRWIGAALDHSDSPEVAVPAYILAFCWDMIGLLQDPDYHESTIQAYRQAARAWLLALQAPKVDIVEAFSHALGDLDADWELTSGKSMQLLWDRWRPVTASEPSQLSFLAEIRAISARFDRVWLNTQLPLAQIADMRLSLSEAQKSILAGAKDHSLIASLGQVMSEFESRLSGWPTTTSTYYRDAFETLCQYHALQQPQKPVLVNLISLLAGRSTSTTDCTALDSSIPELLQSIALFAGPQESAEGRQAIQGTLPLRLISRVASVADVPVKSLWLLDAETQTLAQALSASASVISMDQIAALQKALRKLLHELLACHQDIFTRDSVEIMLAGLLTGVSEPRPCHLHVRDDFVEVQFGRQLAQAFTSCYHLINTRHTCDIPTLGAACIRLAAVCLRLFVPDKPFDPSLNLVVRRKQYDARLSAQIDLLKCLRAFEHTFTGCDTSLAIRLTEEALASLGTAPPEPPLTRPQPSQSAELQGEFSSIISTVLTPEIEQVTVQSTIPVALLRKNVQQMCRRLRDNYPAYGDVVTLTVRFLELLDLGLSFFPQSEGDDAAMSEVGRFRRLLPLLAQEPLVLSNISDAVSGTSEPPAVDLRLHRIAMIGVMQASDPTLLSQHGYRQLLRDDIQALYTLWKQQLRADQLKEAERTKMYRYRGSAEDEEAEDDEELNRLFPTYDTDAPARNQSHAALIPPFNVSSIGHQLHQAIATLFSRANAAQLLQTLFATALEKIGSLAATIKPSSRESDPAPYLAGVLLLLAKQETSINSSCNFYIDANVPEVKRLASLVRSIRTRFLDLHQSWPNHAAITDVLDCCAAIFEFRHGEPLAKFITKTEQLHGLMHQWQLVASSQYSAAELFNELTSLLISWRRLELTTWSQLFDSETSQCERDASAWWFIAYETVVEAPLKLAQEDQSLQDHCYHLVEVLSQFLSSTPHGQYAARLHLLEQLSQLLGLYSVDQPSLQCVRSALDNVRSHYEAFVPTISRALAEGRTSLEKQVQEVIKLASWKDTNIVALRDSAKRSHHKLFKYVRKYRELLAQSCEPILASGSSADSDRPSSSHAQDLNVMDLKPALPQWNKICDASVIGDRPSRFQDPSATADNMLAVYSAAVDTLDVSQDVSAFVTEVLDTVTSLRAKTPKVLTEENHAEVQHLKVLKKRFFADTLKAIRAMGVRPNLTTDVLGKQASLAAILASTPAIHSMNGVSFKLDDAYFHRLIDLLPKIRVCSRDYAEDLSNVEVARSVGSLEGLLHWVMQQRVTIAVHVTQVQSLSASVEQIVQLCNCSAEALCHDTEKTRSIDTIRGSLQWLRTVLAMADAVVHIYARYNGESGDAVLGAIAVMMEDLSGHIQQLDGLAVLPPGVSVQSREASCDAAVECIARARTTLNDMITLHPSCAFVLRGILPHLSLQFCPVSPRQCSTTAGAHLLEKAATGVADKMLVCLQRISRLPGSASDDSPAWLKKSDQLLIRSLAELHMQDISRELRGTLDHLSVLAQDCSSLPVASAIVASLAPITQRYHFICVDILRRYTGFNRELSKMAYLLGKSFIQIASDGFCSPEQNSEEQGKAGKLESGTGLGEGEGAEDISKDVQDDEDLSDLAQDKQKMDDKEGPDEDNEEAVNMDQEDLEADASDFEKEDNHDKSEEPSDDEDEQDIDEESGSVDPLDADAVDEKMWDGAQDEEQHNVETDREQGTTQSGDATAAADEDHSPAEQQPDEPRADDQDSDGPDNEDEAVGPPDDAEMTDPHAKEEQVLDLPEDMDLDGLDHEKETSDSEDGLDDLSDVDPLDQSAPEMQKEDQEQAITPDEVKASDDPGQEEDKPMDDEEEGHSADVEVEDEDEQQPVNQNEDILQAESEDRSADQEQVAPSDAVTSGIDFDEHAQDQRGTAGDAQQAEQATDDSENIQPQSEEAAEGVEKGEASKEGGGRDDESADRQPEQAFQKLGDILEKWHRRQQEIQQAQDEEAGARQQREDLDLQEVDFEHLADDNDVADTQALGQASEEQAKGLDDRQAIESEEQPHDENILPLPDEPEQDPDTVPSTDPMDVESKADAAEERRAGAIIAGTGNTHDSQVGDIARTDEFSDLEDVDASLSALHMSCAELVPIDEARRLWSHHESVTHDLALSLTEQLRLILAPTMATKLRGDYRTGKRLNIKRIIPYIASQFKRDKIWMRRSVPSKRNYQIMLAVDDSKSMQESGSSQLAYETLALVARSLSMLEVGDLCVVGFGNEDHVRIAHEFGKTFSSEAGVHIFQQFSFQQTGTNVRQLIADSLALFRDAKNQQSRGSGNADLWQLQLIISDGICEDHDTIRRLVRQAQDERVMIVFIIVDATKGSSILDLTQARFEPDASGTGEMKLKMTRYLEGFPFAYYLVVRDVQELPAVLSLALKQWFAEVVDNAA